MPLWAMRFTFIAEGYAVYMIYLVCDFQVQRVDTALVFAYMMQKLIR